MSLRVYSIRDSEPGHHSGSALKCVPTRWAKHQTIVFFIVTKLYIYIYIIYQIKDLEELVKIPDCYPINCCHLAQIYNQKFGLHSGGSLEKLKFGRQGKQCLEEMIEHS